MLKQKGIVYLSNHQILWFGFNRQNKNKTQKLWLVSIRKSANFLHRTIHRYCVKKQAFYIKILGSH